MMSLKRGIFASHVEKLSLHLVVEVNCYFKDEKFWRKLFIVALVDDLESEMLDCDGIVTL